MIDLAYIQDHVVPALGGQSGPTDGADSAYTDEEASDIAAAAWIEENIDGILADERDAAHKPLIAQANRTLNRAVGQVEKHAVHNQKDHGNRYGSDRRWIAMDNRGQVLFSSDDSEEIHRKVREEGWNPFLVKTTETGIFSSSHPTSEKELRQLRGAARREFNARIRRGESSRLVEEAQVVLFRLEELLEQKPWEIEKHAVHNQQDHGNRYGYRSGDLVYVRTNYGSRAGGTRVQGEILEINGDQAVIDIPGGPKGRQITKPLSELERVDPPTPKPYIGRPTPTAGFGERFNALPKTTQRLIEALRDSGTVDVARDLWNDEFGPSDIAFSLDTTWEPSRQSMVRAAAFITDESQRKLREAGYGDTLTVYRGGGAPHSSGPSGTSLDRRVSERFAERSGSGQVSEFQISIDDVLYFSDALWGHGTFAESEVGVMGDVLKEKIVKGVLSGEYHNTRRRRAEQIRNLKRKRKYKKPVPRFGRTKSERSTFGKHLPGQHDQKTHGRKQGILDKYPDLPRAKPHFEPGDKVKIPIPDSKDIATGTVTGWTRVDDNYVSVILDGTGKTVKLPKTMIRKHGDGSHDEESHGNWATGTITDQGKERGRESLPSPKTAQPPPPSPEVNAYQLLELNQQRLATEFRPGIDDNPEIVALAAERFQTALAQEQAITPILTQVAAQTGGDFQHFDQRVKYESSIREKIPRIQREHAEANKPVPSNAEAAAQISDLNRYTLMFSADSYGQGVKATVATLQSQGWEVLKAKNAWAPGDHYDGINAKFVRPSDGAVFELQFHTPESAVIKDQSHKLYQQARSPLTSPEQVSKLKQQILNLWNADRSFVPTGAETVFGTQFAYVGKAKEIAVSYYVKLDDTGQVFAFYRVRPDGSAEVLRSDGTWGESTAVTALDLAGLGGEVYQQATADQAAKWARGDTPEVLEVNRQLNEAIRDVEKHAAPIHPGTGTDQSVHGGGGQLERGTTGMNGEERREGQRRTKRWRDLHVGECYEGAGRFMLDNRGGKLVHGVVRAVEGDVAHGWVVLDDGYVYEPTTDAIYHPDDFVALHSPMVAETYTPVEAMSNMGKHKHWGPWDETSEHWYEIYHGEVSIFGDHDPGHRGRSKFATEDSYDLEEGYQ